MKNEGIIKFSKFDKLVVNVKKEGKIQTNAMGFSVESFLSPIVRKKIGSVRV